MPRDDRLFTRKARRPWWMGRPLDRQTWLAIIVLSPIIVGILELVKLIGRL